MSAPAFAFIYLASQSPRRAQLLDQLGVAHRPLLPDPGEDAEALEAALPRESPTAYVQRVTALKLDAACTRLARRGLTSAPVLCADTTVALGREMLGKPADAAEARRMLAQLSGRMHRVLTAVALEWGPAAKNGKDGKTEKKRRRRDLLLSVSQVRFAPLTRAQIAAYVDGGEPMGKAGAYAVQGRAAAFIEHMRGSYSGIMGLPMFETAQLLRRAGIAV